MSDWQTPMRDAPQNELVLLLLGETIPDLPDIRAGSFIDASSCAELGHHDFGNGGWMIWNSGSDWFVLEMDEPLAWAHAPAGHKQLLP